MFRARAAGYLHRRSGGAAVPFLQYHGNSAFIAVRLASSSSAFSSSASPSMSEDRVARWCSRLWRLAKTPSGDPSEAADAAASPFHHLDQLKDLTDIASTAEGETLEPDVVLSRLRRAIRGDHGRIPGVIVENVWDAFDLLLPPYVQQNTDQITAEHQNRFFEFIGTLNELDFDLVAVTEANRALTEKLRAYTSVLRELEAAEGSREADGNQKNGKGGYPESSLPPNMQPEQQLLKQSQLRDLNDRRIRAKGDVMYSCFQVRNAGAPLYYTWLRHTASMTDGLKRLMQFRKTSHYFESLCNAKVKELKKNQLHDRVTKATAAAAVPSPVNSTQEKNPAGAQEVTETELFKWRRRQLEVGLIDSALSMLFHDFFSTEYLVMEELTWYSTPPSLLEQIMKAESVHPFERGLNDMRQRLQPTHHRHLFAFLHPAVVEEPLIAVQVALTKGVASSVDVLLSRPTPLLDPGNQTKAGRQLQELERGAPVEATPEKTASDNEVDTAIFYSINSAQSALRGMDMGNRLIKRVVREIDEKLNTLHRAQRRPTITTFSTLSPVPLYVKWLATEVEKMQSALAAYSSPPAPSAGTAMPRPVALFGEGISAEEEEQRYYTPLRRVVLTYAERYPSTLPTEAAAVRARVASLDSTASRAARWAANAAVMKYLVRLFQTAAVFDAPVPAAEAAPHQTSVNAAAELPRQPWGWWLHHELTGAIEAPLLRSMAVYLATVKRAGGRRIYDPVGNFHVSNGATVLRLNFLGNCTPQGSRESACTMVNYWYDMPTVSANVASYEVSHSIALGEPMQILLRDDKT